MKLVKAHGNAELAKRPRKSKENKWAKEAQEKKGTQEPMNKERNQWPYQATGRKNEGLA